MRAIYITVLFCAILCLQSCDKHESVPAGTDTMPVSVTFQPEDATAGKYAGLYAYDSREINSVNSVIYENVMVRISEDGTAVPEDSAMSVSEGMTMHISAYFPYKDLGQEGIDMMNYPVDLSEQTENPDLELRWGESSEDVDYSNRDISIRLSRVLSEVNISVSGTAGVRPSDLENMEIEFSGLYNEGIMKIDDGQIINTGMPGTIVPQEILGNSKYRAVVLPTGAGDYRNREIVVRVPVLGKEFKWAFPDDYMFEKGQVYDIAIEVDTDGISVKTLDIHPWEGADSNPEFGSGDEENMYLPNSYIVKPGKEVSIPVSKAYAMWRNDPVLQGSGIAVPDDFIAEIVWQERFADDTEKLITSNDMITVSGSGQDAVLTIRTNEVEGNFVVGIKDGNEYFWSWHVWVTEYEPDVDNCVMGGKIFMDRNLGAVNTVTGPQSSGMYYQWGRKDAFPGSYSWEKFSTDNVGWANNGIGKIVMLKNKDASGVPENNIVASVRNPYYMIRQNDYNTRDWVSKESGYMPDRWKTADGRKSPYDPCPEGWEVPASGSAENSVWYGLGDAFAWDSDRKGFVSGDGSDIYFPASGYIAEDVFGREVAENGYLWSSTSAGRGGYSLLFNSETLTVDKETDKVKALPVRCVKSE